MQRIHPEDHSILSALLRTDDLPEDVQSEYAECRALWSGIGGSGMLPPNLIVDMLRRLGYSRMTKSEKDTNFDSLKGNQCLALIGDEEVEAKFIGKSTTGFGVIEEKDGTQTEMRLDYIKAAPPKKAQRKPTPQPAAK